MPPEPVSSRGYAGDANAKPVIPLDPAAIYAFAHRIRVAEEILLKLFEQGQLAGTTHTCIGQEFCQMSVVRALNHPHDTVFSNHRNHGHFLTYSGEFAGLFAEIMGREDGVCGGRGGSQHLAFRNFHSSGVQGGMTAIAVGQALAKKYAPDGSIVVAIIGDGTLGQGLVYESLNLAATWGVPLLFVVENNSIAQTTPTRSTTAGSITGRGEAFGLQTWHLSDDSHDFFECIEDVVATVRDQSSPGFLVIDTVRLGPHSKGDDTRLDNEMRPLRDRDPLARLGNTLPGKVRHQIEADNSAFLEAALEAARQSRPARFASVPHHGFEHNSPEPANSLPEPASSENSVRQSLNQALREILANCDRAILIGEDLHDPYGGAFKVTAGLSSAHPERVLSTPISEAGIVGAGTGLAMAGWRPVIEIMFADFLSLAMDQIYNHAVKFPSIFDDLMVPLVIRTACGGGRGYGATHSQITDNMCASVPGLTVVFGSHRHDMGELLKNAVQLWDHPTLFFEHKLLYSMANGAGAFDVLMPSLDDVASQLFPMLSNGRADPDVAIVTYGGMSPLVETVAEQLENEEEISVEIILLGLISPLPRHTLVEALSSRKRIAIVEESPVEFGVGGEIAAVLAESGYKGKLARIGAPSVPIPSARSLEKQILPGHARIFSEICAMF